MTDQLWSIALSAAERGLVPDPLVRFGIRRLCASRLAEEARRDVSDDRFVRMTAERPIAPVPEAANKQHYEAPAELFRLALGPHLKYSCCHWDDGVASLGEAERSALAITSERAGLSDGQDVLELGCGWGSLTLWMAEHYPNSRITGVSNSHSQRRFIERRAAERGLCNLRVLTRDMNEFTHDDSFDRVVSVEMFEHMRNYGELLRRIEGWLRTDGRLFVHVFCHRRHTYEFETDGAANWLGRFFFTGGVMPSAALLPKFADALTVADQWTWNGRHYEKTANAWIENMDRHQDELMAVMAHAYGADQARVWFHRWRIFFAACAELWGFDQGREWQVAHYLFEKAAKPQRTRTQSLVSAL